MPISDKQLAANRVNAKKSTGPRTAEGKQKVSRNAFKHGLTARYPVVPPDLKPEYDQLAAALRAEIMPCGALEQEAFLQLLHSSWQLRRADRYENALFDPAAAPDAQLALVERLARLRATLERSSQRAYRRLRELQIARSAEDTHPFPEAIGHAVTTPLAPLPREKNQTHFFPQDLYDKYLALSLNPTVLTGIPFRARLYIYNILRDHPRNTEPPTKSNPRAVKAA